MLIFDNDSVARQQHIDAIANLIFTQQSNFVFTLRPSDIAEFKEDVRIAYEDLSNRVSLSGNYLSNGRFGYSRYSPFYARTRTLIDLFEEPFDTNRLVDIMKTSKSTESRYFIEYILEDPKKLTLLFDYALSDRYLVDRDSYLETSFEAFAYWIVSENMGSFLNDETRSIDDYMSLLKRFPCSGVIDILMQMTDHLDHKLALVNFFISLYPVASPEIQNTSRTASNDEQFDISKDDPNYEFLLQMSRNSGNNTRKVPQRYRTSAYFIDFISLLHQLRFQYNIDINEMFDVRANYEEAVALVDAALRETPPRDVSYRIYWNQFGLDKTLQIILADDPSYVDDMLNPKGDKRTKRFSAAHLLLSFRDEIHDAKLQPWIIKILTRDLGPRKASTYGNIPTLEQVSFNNLGIERGEYELNAFVEYVERNPNPQFVMSMMGVLENSNNKLSVFRDFYWTVLLHCIPITQSFDLVIDWITNSPDIGIKKSFVLRMTAEVDKLSIPDFWYLYPKILAFEKTIGDNSNLIVQTDVMMRAFTIRALTDECKEFAPS